MTSVLSRKSHDRPSFPPILFVLVLICGLLDATAVVSTATFGIGVYIVADAIAVTILIARAVILPNPVEGIPRRHLTAGAACIGLIWLLTIIQVWKQVGTASTLFTQASLRTILIGHFLVCSTIIVTADKAKLLRTTLACGLALYLAYGLYDMAAQLLGYPRFLSFLRNNASFFISTEEGAQGWIQLPRLSSLAAEPSHTLIHVSLALFVFMYMRGLSRILGVMLAITFALGTFSRTLWMTILGASIVTLGIRTLHRFERNSGAPYSRAAVFIAALCLPVIVITVPLLPSIGETGDLSFMERLDTSRTALWLFLDNPLLGVGFQGWQGQYFFFSDKLIGPAHGLSQVHNGFAVYLAAMGIAGLTIVYAPLLLLVSSEHLSPPAKGWWISTYCLSALGGDYIAMPSTWTALAVALLWSVQD